MVMPGSTVTTPSPQNKNLYNGGSEWQNDYNNNMPGYYQTFYRNYDAAIGRFVGVDPEAEGAESLTVYQYAGNNPIMGNDPMGNVRKMIEESYSHNGPDYDFMGYGDGQGHGGGGSVHGAAWIEQQQAIDVYENTSDEYQQYAADLSGANGWFVQAAAKEARAEAEMSNVGGQNGSYYASRAYAYNAFANSGDNTGFQGPGTRFINIRKQQSLESA